MIPTLGIFLAVTLQASTFLVPGGTITFHINDDDLNTSPRGIDEISTAGLLDFKIAGTTIPGPSTITETGSDTGIFTGTVSIPITINGRAVTQDDVLTITYHDQSDPSGNPKTFTKSVTAKKVSASFGTTSKNIRIGQNFQLRIYEPGFNLDSKYADNIPLSLVEFKGTDGIRTTIDNSAFEANTKSLRETGPNTNHFVVTLKMPKEIDGKRTKIGSIVQFTFTDTASSTGTTQKIKSYVRLGLR